MQTTQSTTEKLQSFISICFNKYSPEDIQTLEQLKNFCKEGDINRTQFIKSAIKEKLAKGTR